MLRCFKKVSSHKLILFKIDFTELPEKVDMKVVASENTNAFSSSASGVYAGKITKHHQHHHQNNSGIMAGGGTSQRKDIENEEIRVYLSKLKELVPFMPKNRKLSKLEVIQYVIDYIYDLQYALDTHPTLNSAAVHSAAAAMLASQSQPTPSSMMSSSSTSFSSINNNNNNTIHRQPLGILPPNSNVQVTATATASNPENTIEIDTTATTIACNNTMACNSLESDMPMSVISNRAIVSEKMPSSPTSSPTTACCSSESQQTTVHC